MGCIDNTFYALPDIVEAIDELVYSLLCKGSIL